MNSRSSSNCYCLKTDRSDGVTIITDEAFRQLWIGNNRLLEAYVATHETMLVAAAKTEKISFDDCLV